MDIVHRKCLLQLGALVDIAACEIIDVIRGSVGGGLEEPLTCVRTVMLVTPSSHGRSQHSFGTVRGNKSSRDPLNLNKQFVPDNVPPWTGQGVQVVTEVPRRVSMSLSRLSIPLRIEAAYVSTHTKENDPSRTPHIRPTSFSRSTASLSPICLV